MERKKTSTYRLSRMTEIQIFELADSLGMSRANVIQTAVDRLYQQEMKNMNSDEIYINKVQAVADCFDALLRGVDTPTIIQNEDGTFDYIPGAYLTDGSYTGSRQVVMQIPDASVFGDWNIEDEAEREEVASWVAAQGDWSIEAE